MNTLAPKPRTDQTAINTVIDTATARWRRNKQPDSFTTKVAIRQDGQVDHVNVRIYHHETFPLGGQTFTVDVRALPDNRETPGQLFHRARIHLAPHERCR